MPACDLGKFLGNTQKHDHLFSTESSSAGTAVLGMEKTKVVRGEIRIRLGMIWSGGRTQFPCFPVLRGPEFLVKTWHLKDRCIAFFLFSTGKTFCQQFIVHTWCVVRVVGGWFFSRESDDSHCFQFLLNSHMSGREPMAYVTGNEPLKLDVEMWMCFEFRCLLLPGCVRLSLLWSDGSFLLWTLLTFTYVTSCLCACRWAVKLNGDRSLTHKTYHWSVVAQVSVLHSQICKGVRETTAPIGHSQQAVLMHCG